MAGNQIDQKGSLGVNEYKSVSTVPEPAAWGHRMYWPCREAEIWLRPRSVTYKPFTGVLREQS